MKFADGANVCINTQNINHGILQYTIERRLTSKYEISIIYFLFLV